MHASIFFSLPRAIRESVKLAVEHATAYQQELEVFWRPARHTGRLLTTVVTQTFRPPHTCQSVGEREKLVRDQILQKSFFLRSSSVSFLLESLQSYCWRLDDSWVACDVSWMICKNGTRRLLLWLPSARRSRITGIPATAQACWLIITDDLLLLQH